MIEVERRYKVLDPESTVWLLQQNNIEVADEQRIVDMWFAPTTVHSQTDENQWFDVEHGIAYRIRRTESQVSGSQIILDSKQHTEANNHNTFKEEVLMNDDEVAMERFLEAKGYYNWLTIDKRRRIFSSNQQELSISMDTIDGVKQELGVDTVLEVEYIGEGSREDALSTIDAFVSSIKLSSYELFEASLTVEAMRVLAKFR